MKALALIFLFYVGFTVPLLAQRTEGIPPKLQLVGSNFSYTKGNIDVEVLTEIIQQKQEEVAQRAFRNLVIKGFTNKIGANKSFTTYFYIYNLLNTLTIEKSKTVITRNVVNNLLEYAIIYGLTDRFLKSDSNKQEVYYFKKDKKIIDSVFLAGLPTPQQLSGETLINTNSKDSTDKVNPKLRKWRTFNKYLDMAYDVILTDKSQFFQERGLFKSIKAQNLNQWYESDNAYLLNKKEPDLIKHRKLMEEYYEKFKEKSILANEIINVFKELDSTDFVQEGITEKQFDAIKKILRSSITYYKDFSDNNTIANMSEYLLDYTFIEFKKEDADTTKKVKKQGIIYIDSEGLISKLYDKYVNPVKMSQIAKKRGYLKPSLFLTIGTTYGTALSAKNQLDVDQNNTPQNLGNIFFASEKIGLKFTFMDRLYTRSFQPGEEYKYLGESKRWRSPQEIPTISRIELMFYGSGLLYNVVNVKSNKNFNYALVGTSLGLTFFNGLNFNIGASVPINANNGATFKDKILLGASFDIPIIEYLTAVRKKRN